jgi:hypothetical protein
MTGGFMVIVPEGRCDLSEHPLSNGMARAAGGRQGVHPLHVPGHRDEAPLTLDLVKATQEELAPAAPENGVAAPVRADRFPRVLRCPSEQPAKARAAACVASGEYRSGNLEAADAASAARDAAEKTSRVICAPVAGRGRSRATSSSARTPPRGGRAARPSARRSWP